MADGIPDGRWDSIWNVGWYIIYEFGYCRWNAHGTALLSNNLYDKMAYGIPDGRW
jgi:hypothetical protein